MKYPLLSLVCISLLSACGSDIVVLAPDGPQTITFDFDTGKQGWQAAYSDYPTDNADIYELSSGILSLPDDTTHNGFFMSGMNRSDDLFMYLKARFTGFEPLTRYTANVDMTIYSNAGDDCFGVGGAPGSSVYLKFGYAETEPKQDDYYLNVDKGNQSNGGANANVIGDMVIEGLPCEGTEFSSKTIKTTEENQLEFTSAADGSIWFFIGTDSGYEGRTDVYYDKISITVQPAI
ncbi:hypothetical protein [Neptunicella marina]|uniref:Lipoprotein n=1 Tax=Neptunicella marina TaxID=2125989 RepID=A0A8J6IV95_9ALTE|nr:hypothetical protein [Neptunicella marina]MBC3766241.1 hypothetical protein [Neptunicella marina]